MELDSLEARLVETVSAICSGPKGTAKSHAVLLVEGDVKASAEETAVAVPAIPIRRVPVPSEYMPVDTPSVWKCKARYLL